MTHKDDASTQFAQALTRFLQAECEGYRDRDEDDPEFRKFLLAAAAWDVDVLPKRWKSVLQEEEQRLKVEEVMKTLGESEFLTWLKEQCPIEDYAMDYVLKLARDEAKKKS